MSQDPAFVRRMFAKAAPRYDLLNRLLSLGLDGSWRRAAAGAMEFTPGNRVLDLCCGSGDLTLAMNLTSPVFGCDFTMEMVRLAQAKLGSRAELTTGDALSLPYASNEFDSVAIAFGIRNLADLSIGLAEMRRVLKRDGQVIVLEFSRPQNRVFRLLHRIYLQMVVIGLGRLISPDSDAYRYLADTISDFPEPGDIVREMHECGFSTVDQRPLSGGIVVVYVAEG